MNHVIKIVCLLLLFTTATGALADRDGYRNAQRADRPGQSPLSDSYERRSDHDGYNRGGYRKHRDDVHRTHPRHRPHYRPGPHYRSGSPIDQPGDGRRRGIDQPPQYRYLQGDGRAAPLRHVPAAEPRHGAPRRGINEVIDMVERRYGGKVVGVETAGDHYRVRLLQRDGRVRTLRVPGHGY